MNEIEKYLRRSHREGRAIRTGVKLSAILAVDVGTKIKLTLPQNPTPRAR